jgi:hypothetical protein
VDQDDPEKRIADLEHRLAEQNRGANLLPAEPPPAISNAGSKTRRGRRSVGVGGWLAVVFFVLMASISVWIDARNVYGYLAGTPTTATIVGCSTRRGGVHCTGTWSVGGLSHNGPIEAYESYPTGSAQNVHARGDTAYTEAWHHWRFYVRAGVGILIAVCVPLVALRRRTDR